MKATSRLEKADRAELGRFGDASARHASGTTTEVLRGVEASTQAPEAVFPRQ